MYQKKKWTKHLMNGMKTNLLRKHPVHTMAGEGIFSPSKGSFSAFKNRRNNNDYMKNAWEASGEYTWPQKGKGWKDTFKEASKYAIPTAIGTLAIGGILSNSEDIKEYLGAYDYLADANYDDVPLHGYRDNSDPESWFSFNQRWGENVADPFLNL